MKIGKMPKFRDYLKEELQDNENFVGYVNALLEEYHVDRNQELFFTLLKDAIKMRGGVTDVAKNSHVSRQTIYKMLSPKGSTTFNNMESLLGILGIKLQAVPADNFAAT